MAEKVEVIFQTIISALQIAKLYSTSHPKFFKFLDHSFELLQAHVIEKGDLIIGIIGEELAYDKEILFDLSKTIKPTIVYFKSRGIERIVFQKGLQKEELKKFIDFLNKPKDEIANKDLQELLALMGIRNILVGKIKVGSGGDVKSGSGSGIDYQGIYSDSMDNFQDTVDKILNSDDLDYLNLRFNVTNTMENLINRHQELLKLITIKRYDMTTFVHVLNVSMLAMFFSYKLGFSRDEILDIGTAAMFHDIGKLYISRGIIKKTDKLNEDEFKQVRNHSVFGSEILLKYVDNLGILPVVVCFEHHLKYDLSGYPKVPLPHKIHIASLIVSICDVYDALFQRRSYKAGYPANVVYDIMQKEKGRYFDPGLLEIFFQIMGAWPMGSIVKLNDGRIAIVREENAENIFLPKVEIVYPENNKEVIDLLDFKDKIKIDKSLDPLEDGKAYVKLV